jgi:hypothetical protein
MDNYSKMKGESSDKASKERARKILGDQGSASDCKTSTKFNADNDKMRPYKKGGMVKKSCK